MIADRLKPDPAINAEFEEPVSVADVRATILNAANVLSRNPSDTAEAGICILEAVRILDRLPPRYEDIVRERNDINRIVVMADYHSPGDRPQHEVAAKVFDIVNDRYITREDLATSRRLAQDSAETIDAFIFATDTKNVREALKRVRSWARTIGKSTK
jgi:hypothetical protein